MRLLLTGASGQLGAWVLREAQRQGHDVVAWCGSHPAPILGITPQIVALTSPDAIQAAFHHTCADAVIHCAASSTIAACHRDPAMAERINVQATSQLVELAAKHKRPMLFVSTDLVFDGEQGWYGEGDAPRPLSVYGRTKRNAELPVLHYERGTVSRVSLLYGPALAGRTGFFDQQVQALREQRPIPLFTDEWRTPASLLMTARALLAVLNSGYRGLLHIGGPERLSRYEMGQRLAAVLKADPACLQAVERASAPAPEPRPCDVSLDSAKFRSLFPTLPWPDMDAALREMQVA